MAIWPRTSCKLCQLGPVHCTVHTWPSTLLLYPSSSFILTGNGFAAVAHGNIAENILQTLSVGTSPLHCSHLTIHSDIVGPKVIYHFCLHLLLSLTTFTSAMLLVRRSGGHWQLTQSQLQQVVMWGVQGSVVFLHLHSNRIFHGAGNRIFPAPHGHVPQCFFQYVPVPCGLSDRLELFNNLLWVSSLLQTSRGNSVGRNGGGLAQGP